MLTFDELLGQVKQLTVEDRIAFLEEVAHSLREELSSAKNETTEVPNEQPKSSSLDRLYGILKTDIPAPSDEEIRADYTEYLSKKYA